MICLPSYFVGVRYELVVVKLGGRNCTLSLHAPRRQDPHSGNIEMADKYTKRRCRYYPDERESESLSTVGPRFGHGRCRQVCLTPAITCGTSRARALRAAVRVPCE